MNWTKWGDLIAALKRFKPLEINGINLGFSESKHGAAFGEKLRRQVLKNRNEIIRNAQDWILLAERDFKMEKVITYLKSVSNPLEQKNRRLC